MPVMTETVAGATLGERVLASDRTARVLGGGTILMQRVNAGDPNVRKLIRVQDPALTQISATGSSIRIGAGVTMAQILASPDMAFLHDAARVVGGPAIRNMATVGGNLFARAPYGDLAVMLLALDARAETAGGRSLSLPDLWRGGAGAMITELHLTRPDPSRCGFAKMARTRPRGPAVVSVAVVLDARTDPRIAFGAVEDHPVLARSAATQLGRGALDAARIDRAARAAASGLNPRTDSQASAWYRAEMMQVQLHRLLNRMGNGGA